MQSIAHTDAILGNLATALCEGLSQGLVVTPAVSRFIDEVFLNPSPDDLAMILAEDGPAERDALLELLFFPEEALQIRLEPMLGDAPGLSPEAVETLHKQLIHKMTAVPLTLPGPPPKVMSIPFSSELAEKFIRRLNLATTLDRAVLKTVAMHVPPASVAWVRVKLRNAALAKRPEQSELLCRFFNRIRFQSPDFEDCFAYLIDFLGEWRGGQSPVQALQERKNMFQHHLEQADGYARRLSRGNIETLMLQGARNPCVDREQLRRRIFLVERICLGLFDVVPGGDARTTQSVDIDRSAAGKDLQTVMRKFADFG